MKPVRRSVSLLIGGSLLLLLSAACFAPPPPPGVIYAPSGPPAAQVEVIGTAPGPDFVWIHGHYRWEAIHYVWGAGQWERRPHASAAWVDGRWMHHSNGWYWQEGHWR